MQLSANFHLAEFTRSARASRRGARIANVPSRGDVASLRLLCLLVMQPLREATGPISISSGYRSKKLNAAIRGDPKSQHMFGEAADFEVAGLSNLAAAELIVEMGLPFDQLILEFHQDGVPHSGWLHISHAAARPQRGLVQSALPGERHLADGLVAF